MIAVITQEEDSQFLVTLCPDSNWLHSWNINKQLALRFATLLGARMAAVASIGIQNVSFKVPPWPVAELIDIAVPFDNILFEVLAPSDSAYVKIRLDKLKNFDQQAAHGYWHYVGGKE